MHRFHKHKIKELHHHSTRLFFSLFAQTKRHSLMHTSPRSDAVHAADIFKLKGHRKQDLTLTQDRLVAQIVRVSQNSMELLKRHNNILAGASLRCAVAAFCATGRFSCFLCSSLPRPSMLTPGSVFSPLRATLVSSEFRANGLGPKAPRAAASLSAFVQRFHRFFFSSAF